MGAVTPQHFEALFSSSIRTQFNWRAFRRGEWPVRLDVIDNHAMLGEMQLPWTIDDVGNAVGMMAADARPIRVKQVPELMHRFPNSRRQQILELGHSYAHQRFVSVVMAAYRTHEGLLILDGCHRSAALYLAARTFTVAMFCVIGPADVGAIIDLEHVLFP